MGPSHLPNVFDVTDEAGPCHIVFSRGFQDWLATQIEAADPLQVAQRLTHCCRRHLAAIAPMWMELSPEERNRICPQQQAAWFDELLRLLFPAPQQPSASEALEYFRQRHHHQSTEHPTPVSAYLHVTEKLVDEVLMGQHIEKTYRDAIVLICLGALLNKQPRELMEHFSTHESNISRSPSDVGAGANQKEDTAAPVVTRSQTDIVSGQYQIVHQTIANFDTVPSSFAQRTQYTTNAENARINREVLQGEDLVVAQDVVRGRIGNAQEIQEVAVETTGWESPSGPPSRHFTDMSVSLSHSAPLPPPSHIALSSSAALSDSPTFTEPDAAAPPPTTQRFSFLFACLPLFGKPGGAGAPASATVVVQTSAKGVHAKVTVSTSSATVLSESLTEDAGGPRTRQFSFTIQRGLPMELRLASADEEERKRRFSEKRLPMEIAEGTLFRSSKVPDSLTDVTTSLATESQSLSSAAPLREGRTSATFLIRDGVPVDLNLIGQNLSEEERQYLRSLRLSTATEEAINFLAAKIVPQVLMALNLPTNSTYSVSVHSSDASLTESISLVNKVMRSLDEEKDGGGGGQAASSPPTSSISPKEGGGNSRLTTEVAGSLVNKVIQGLDGEKDAGGGQAPSSTPTLSISLKGGSIRPTTEVAGSIVNKVIRNVGKEEEEEEDGGPAPSSQSIRLGSSLGDASSVNTYSRPTTEVANSVVNKALRGLGENEGAGGGGGGSGGGGQPPDSRPQSTTFGSGSRHTPREVSVCDPRTHIVQKTNPDDGSITFKIDIVLPGA